MMLLLNLGRILSRDGLESSDDLQAGHTCPFCTGKFGVASLCLHIEAEHSFEKKAVVCPVCSTIVKNDIVGHITAQHGHLLKMQRQMFRTTAASIGSALSSIIKESGMIAVEVQPSGKSSWPAGDTSHLATDPFANILHVLPQSEDRKATKLKGATLNKDYCTNQGDSITIPCTSVESKEKLQAATSHAGFVQQLVLSIVFREL
ncbi:hypothetical protein KP509_12G035000 [Ceratopteris richardii]|uniref:Di19 zinc-binding domain-containing protein n=1 Tax=Ceratopteris richardii TaxID=49495 RepID=A0A8T2TI53_CERRI|nr:hypothetical protein KP509_12G035000 [Ceratopteris richardii]